MHTALQGSSQACFQRDKLNIYIYILVALKTQMKNVNEQGCQAQKHQCWVFSCSVRGVKHKNTQLGCSLDVSIRVPSSCWVVYILEKGHWAQAHSKGDVFMLGTCDYVERNWRPGKKLATSMKGWWGEGGLEMHRHICWQLVSVVGN